LGNLSEEWKVKNEEGRIRWKRRTKSEERRILLPLFVKTFLSKTEDYG